MCISRRDYLMIQKAFAALNEIEGPTLKLGELWYDTLTARRGSGHQGSIFHKTSNLSFEARLGAELTTAGIIVHAVTFKGIAPLLAKLAIFLLPAFYGGIHLTAWNSDFPSISEQLIWKISCFLIIGLIPLLGTTFGIMEVMSYYNVKLGKIIELPLRVLTIMFLALQVILFIAARLCIVVEVFISLRSVPIGVYLTPNWLQMIPHV
ncbi:hypothetical protein K445DRAFT_320742 [Daldinia sp. EC12]|nr:hypothetical protein K445DRAFT_320742 [Daldinia sp. EC12]